MNREDFTAFRDAHYRAIADINDKKGKDYAGDDDALANFKAAAEQLGVDPRVIWAVYAHKHWSAIMSYVKNGDVASEPIEGRIHDCILYLFLLLGLIEDGKPARIEDIPALPVAEGAEGVADRVRRSYSEPRVEDLGQG